MNLPTIRRACLAIAIVAYGLAMMGTIRWHTCRLGECNPGAIQPIAPASRLSAEQTDQALLSKSEVQPQQLCFACNLLRQPQSNHHNSASNNAANSCSNDRLIAIPRYMVLKTELPISERGPPTFA